VYLAYSDTGWEPFVLGVYSSEEKAKDAILLYRNSRYSEPDAAGRRMVPPTNEPEYNIAEYDLDDTE
jgi:hypothetical protein